MNQNQPNSALEMVQLTHLNSRGEVKMVDVSAKKKTIREAVATGIVRCAPETIEVIQNQSAKKGDVLAVIRIAGIQGTKLTPQIIPLAHPIAVHGVDLDVSLDFDAIHLRARVVTSDATGIEMEALTAVSCAALTAIDMIKGIDRSAFIEKVQLEEKRGGRSGLWNRDRDANNDVNSAANDAANSDANNDAN